MHFVDMKIVWCFKIQGIAMAEMSRKQEDIDENYDNRKGKKNSF